MCRAACCLLCPNYTIICTNYNRQNNRIMHQLFM
nr:MAG TPA: hypothetical protein [Caudoviricetes sp.]